MARHMVRRAPGGSGASIGSNYQAQGLELSKQFKRSDGRTAEAGPL